ncbi:MAG: membrane protein [Deferrisomatales bacterium]
MKRNVMLGICAAVVAMGATTASAKHFDLGGFFQVRGIADNFDARNNFIGTLDKDTEDEMFTDQRLRLRLETSLDEWLSFVYYGEIDFQWGDSSYEGTPGRNNGGAIGSDTTNFETKHAYIHIKGGEEIPADFTIGMQGWWDNWDWVFFATDMAGVKVETGFDSVSLTGGLFVVQEGAFQSNDDVRLLGLQASYVPMETLALGADYYYFASQGNGGYGDFFGTVDIAEVLGSSPVNTGHKQLHYAGLWAKYVLPVGILKGWAFYNGGSVDDVQEGVGNVDVSGFAGNLLAQVQTGGLTAAVRGFLFSGDDDLTDGDATFVVNPVATESFAFGDDGFMIFLPDPYWTSAGQYGFAMTDAAYAGYGLWGASLRGSYVPPTLPTARVQAGVGYFASLEDDLAAGDPRGDRNGTGLGTEVFLRAGVTVRKRLDLSINGAYAWLGDFYDNRGGGTAARTGTQTPDDPWEVYLMARLRFD